MSGVRVLLVEGRRTKITTLAPAIKKAGYAVKVVHTGKDALASIADAQPHVVVFDSTAMRSKGARTCRRMREEWPHLPLIHCRAEEDELDESAEADVFLQHPFTPRKVINRIRKLLPATDSEDKIKRLGDITIYQGKKAAHIAGRGEFALTPKLLSLLEVFVDNPNQIVTRPQLMKSVWKTDYIGDTRTLDVHIRWLREVLEDDPAKPQRLRTKRGKGYILVVENHEENN